MTFTVQCARPSVLFPSYDYISSRICSSISRHDAGTMLLLQLETTDVTGVPDADYDPQSRVVHGLS